VTTNPILDAPWPDDLNPADVPLKGRTETVLRRQGFYGNTILFDTLTASDVAGWWNAGPATVNDIRSTGTEAIRLHHETAGLRLRIDAGLSAVTQEPWADRIWYRDPRFAEFLPKVDSTVHDIATSGSAVDRRVLWDRLEDLRAAIARQAELSLDDAVSEYVEVVSGQHGKRLDVLLAVTGLNGQDPIIGPEAARSLNVSHQRICQVVNQLHRRMKKARPAKGAWLPQIAVADETHWPKGYTQIGFDAIRSAFFSPSKAMTEES
jgi:hypothetical protein